MCREGKGLVGRGAVESLGNWKGCFRSEQEWSIRRGRREL